MTEDIGSDRHRNPSSAMLDIAKMKERHAALKEDVGDMKAVIMDIKGLLLAHITNASTNHAQLLATFNQHNLEDTVVHQTVLRIDEHLKNTDANVAELTKRDPLTFWTSLSAAATAVGGIIYMVLHGGNPPPGTP